MPAKSLLSTSDLRCIQCHFNDIGCSEGYLLKARISPPSTDFSVSGILLTRPSPERLELGLSSAGGAAAVAPLFGLSSDGGGVDPLFRFWCHLSQNVNCQKHFK